MFRSKTKWDFRPLEEIATLQRGFDLPVQDRIDGPYPVFAANGPIGNHNVAKVKGPGVVTGQSGSIGKVHLVTTDFWPLNTALWVKDFHGNDVEWVYYLLQWFDLSRFSRGGAVPTLNRNLVHSEKVPHPYLEEQCRIVARIKECMERVEEIESLKSLAFQEYQSLIPAALEDIFHKNGFREIPLFDLLREKPKNGIYLPKSDYVESGGIPIIRMGEMFRRFEVDERVEKSVITNQKLRDDYGLLAGDVLVARRSIVYEGSGSMAMVTMPNQGSIFESSIIRLRLDTDIILPRFFVAFFHSREGFFRRMSITRKATISGINQQGLKRLLVPCPSIQQQADLLKRVDQVRASFGKLQQLIPQPEISALRDSILRKAFAGEL